MDPITFVLLDGSKTTYDVCVSVDGVDTTQFEKNPVMFYQHNDWNMPVGRWENIRKEKGQLLADAIFDTADTDKDVQRMINKVQNGFIKMASCGLVDLECSNDPSMQCSDGDTCCMVVTKCRLREVSIVSIGSNNNAIRLFDNDGKEIDIKKDAGLKLSDFIVKPKIEIMSKKYLTLLNLSDTATEADIDAKVELLLSDKVKVENNLEAEKLKSAANLKLANERKIELDALQLADKTEKTAAFTSSVDEAIKDGRLSEKADGSVKTSLLNLFDKDPASATNLVQSLPTREKAAINLGDTGKTAWQIRQEEIDAANAAKKKK